MILLPMDDISRRLALFLGVGLRTFPCATVPRTYAIVEGDLAESLVVDS